MFLKTKRLFPVAIGTARRDIFISFNSFRFRNVFSVPKLAFF
jgi:hypothetical protein